MDMLFAILLHYFFRTFVIISPVFVDYCRRILRLQLQELISSSLVSLFAHQSSRDRDLTCTHLSQEPERAQPALLLNPLADLQQA